MAVQLPMRLNNKFGFVNVIMLNAKCRGAIFIFIFNGIQDEEFALIVTV
jgi:hypothetical protein